MLRWAQLPWKGGRSAAVLLLSALGTSLGQYSNGCQLFPNNSWQKCSQRISHLNLRLSLQSTNSVSILIKKKVSPFLHHLGVELVNKYQPGKKFHPRCTLGLPQPGENRMCWDVLEDHFVEFAGWVWSVSPLICPYIFSLIIKTLHLQEISYCNRRSSCILLQV